MYRLFVILCLGLLVGGQTPSAEAKKPEPQMLQWNVHWGWQVWPNWWGTTWFLKAEPTLQIVSHVYYGGWFSSSVTRWVTPEGSQSTFAASGGSLYRVTGFQLQFPGSTHSFAGMNWSPSCLPGPDIRFNISPEKRITIINTTGRSLWLFSQNDSDDGKEIKDGETVTRKAGGPHNSLQLQMTPSMESWNTCVSIFWWLS